MKSLLVFIASILAVASFAQNKTLGVGTASPNSNAALHVESPTSNQGLIMPRLTTAQRTAMAALPLTVNDIGLMVYDTQKKSLFTWDGTQWLSSSKLAYPYTDTVTTAPNNSNLFNIIYSGTATESVGIARFVNTNPNNNFQPLFVQNLGINGAGYFQSNNAASASQTLRALNNSAQPTATAMHGYTTGTGPSGGVFEVNNAGNTQPALIGRTTGTGPALVAAQNGASGNIAEFRSNSTTVASVGKDGSLSTTAINITNPNLNGFSAITATIPASASVSNAISGISNSTDAGSYAVLGQHNGPGPGGVFASKDGTGLIGRTQSNVGGALAPVGVYGESTGTGSSAASFRINNTGNTFSAVFGETNGSGPVFFSNQIGTGKAASFQITNAANTSDALFVTTTGTGSAGRFEVNNAASPAPALWVQSNSDQALSAPIYGLNTGKGDVAASFKINNSASTFPALYAETNGTGRGIFVKKTSTVGTQPGIYVSTAGGHGVWADHNGATGYAAIIQNINAANTNAALFAEAAGSGQSIWAQKSDATSTGDVIFGEHDGASGSAGFFWNSNSSNSTPALVGKTAGTGDAVQAEITNAANGANALSAKTSGTGAAIMGQTSTGWTAVYGRKDGTSNGNAGMFEIADAANTYAALQANTVGKGPAAYIQVNNTTGTSPALLATSNGIGSSLMVNHTGTTGDVAVFQSAGANVARVDKTGKGFFNGGTQSSGADVAELFNVEGLKEAYEPGDVLVISEETDRTVEKSNSAVSTRVAGVYATKPGVQLTERDVNENTDDLVPMGVIGVIPTKVCLENGPIKRGDLLVTSSKAGHAMKAVAMNINGMMIYPTGAILGKALENFDGRESGLIKVLVNVK